jgi:hypothetical protein
VKKDVKTMSSPTGESRFFHWLSLGLGAAALASAVLTFLEMSAAPPAPGDKPGVGFLPRQDKAE